MEDHKSNTEEVLFSGGMLDSQIDSCRICNGISILIKLSEEIYNSFKIFSKIKVCCDTSIPGFICLKCYNELRRCVIFYRTVVKADEKLQGLSVADGMCSAEDKNDKLADPFDPDETNFQYAANRTYTKNNLKPRLGSGKHSTKVNTIYNGIPLSISSNFVSCDDCDIHFDDIKQFYEHRRKHCKLLKSKRLPRKRVKRFKRDKPVKSRKSLKPEVTADESNRKRKFHIPCEKCRTVFLTSTIYILECILCKYNFSNCDDLITHFRCHHNAIRERICLECIYSFSNPVQFGKHLKLHTNPSKRYRFELLPQEKKKYNREVKKNLNNVVNDAATPIISTTPISSHKVDQVDRAEPSDIEMATVQPNDFSKPQSSHARLPFTRNQSLDASNTFSERNVTFDSPAIQKDSNCLLPFKRQYCDSQSFHRTMPQGKISLFDLAPLQCLTLEKLTKLPEHINSNINLIDVNAPNTRKDSIIMQDNVELIEIENTESIEEEMSSSNLVEVIQIVESEDILSDDVTNDPEVIVIDDDDDDDIPNKTYSPQVNESSETVKDLLSNTCVDKKPYSTSMNPFPNSEVIVIDDDDDDIEQTENDTLWDNYFGVADQTQPDNTLAAKEETINKTRFKTTMIAKNQNQILTKKIHCPFCPKLSYDNLKDYKTHLKKHGAEKRIVFSCKTCSKIYPEYRLLYYHIKDRHNKSFKANITVTLEKNEEAPKLSL